MSKRVLIITIFILLGAAFFVPPNPYTDKITLPAIKGFKKVYSYFDDKIDLPEIDMPPEKTTVKKWQDKEGNWHFSNAETPAGTKSETIIYTDDVNVMPATKSGEQKK